MINKLNASSNNFRTNTEYTSNHKFAIVVIAYNRLNSFKRLLESIYNADYQCDKIDLIISIDNSGSDIISKYAQSLLWPHGNMIVIEKKKRLGLKKHVLECGDLTKKYEHICVLEDDLYVSPGYYTFAKSSIEHFRNFKEIAGISLYSYEWNQYSDKPFSAIHDGNDVYIMQVSSSWGQIWNRNSWNEFTEWLKDKDDNYLFSDLLPNAVSNWSSKSWLKFHHRFLVDKNKFFVYPRESLSTNFSELGEHVAGSTSTYQVPLLIKNKINYTYPDNLSSAVQYDAFFENIKLHQYLKIEAHNIDINLYGTRKSTKKYLLSTKVLNYKIIKSFGLKMRPMEANVIFNIPGNEIFVYDTTINKKNNKNKIQSFLSEFLYDVKLNSRRKFLACSLLLYTSAISRRLSTFLKSKT